MAGLNPLGRDCAHHCSAARHAEAASYGAATAGQPAGPAIHMCQASCGEGCRRSVPARGSKPVRGPWRCGDVPQGIPLEPPAPGLAAAPPLSSRQPAPGHAAAPRLGEVRGCAASLRLAARPARLIGTLWTAAELLRRVFPGGKMGSTCLRVMPARVACNRPVFALASAVHKVPYCAVPEVRYVMAKCGAVLLMLLTVPHWRAAWLAAPVWAAPRSGARRNGGGGAGVCRDAVTRPLNGIIPGADIRRASHRAAEVPVDGRPRGRHRQ